MARRSELRTINEELFRSVVEKPTFARLEALDDRVARIGSMLTRVLRRRGVAAADAAAPRASTQVEPPTICGQAFDAPGSAGRHRRVDLVRDCHGAGTGGLVTAPVSV